jgi:protein subunit release factor A
MNALAEYASLFGVILDYPREPYQRDPPWLEKDLQMELSSLRTQLRNAEGRLNDWDKHGSTKTMKELQDKYLPANPRKKTRLDKERGFSKKTPESELRALHDKEQAEMRERSLSTINRLKARIEAIEAELKRLSQKK